MHVSVETATDEERSAARQLVQRLGMVFDETLTRHSNIHVERVVTSPRYRLAMLFGKRVVNAAWLAECERAGAPLDPAPFEFGVFERLRLQIHGFDAELAARLRAAAERERATVVGPAASEAPHFVVCADAQATALQPLRGRVPLLPLQWFLYCLRRERFVPPDFFARGELPARGRLAFRLSLEQLGRALAEAEPAPLLTGLRFYFADRAQSEERRVAEAIVSLLGGLHLPRLLGCATHVVAERLARAELAALPPQLKLVTFRFLTECFICRKLPDHREFYPLVVADPGAPAAAPAPAARAVPTIISFLFERLTFHVPHRPQLLRLVRKLTQHCGKVVEDLAQVRDKEVAVVLPDGFDAELLSALRVQLPTALFVSERWVDFCVQRQRVARNLAQHLHLVPLPYALPRPDLQGKRFAFKGFSDAEREELERLAELVGATAAKFDAADATQTHVVENPRAEKFAGLAVHDKKWFLTLVFSAAPSSAPSEEPPS